MDSDRIRADNHIHEPTLALVQQGPLVRDVPVDIWYHAIDMIGDSDTLKICAVTCRTFLRRCRYHLFRCCILRTFHDAKLLVRALRKDADSRSFVRELHLNFNASTKPTGPVAKFLLPMLSSLQVLLITGNWHEIHPSFYISLAPVSQTVTKLVLPTYVPNNIPHLSQLVLALPCLTTLSVNSRGYPAFKTGHEFEGLADEETGSDKPPLSAVHFSTFICSADDSTPAVIRWLRETSVPLALRRMHILMSSGADAVLNMQDLVYMGQNLHTLILDLHAWYKEDPESVVVLPKALSLRSLKLLTYASYLPSAVDLVDSLQPNTLQDLWLVIETDGWWNDGPAPTLFDWSLFADVRGLNDALSRQPSLNRLHVGCTIMCGNWRPSKASSEECRDYILKTWLPHVDPRVWVDGFGDTFMFSED